MYIIIVHYYVSFIILTYIIQCYRWLLMVCLQLFDHIAQCIAEFMKTHSLVGKKLPLGFTFSFPCKQEGLAVGRLVTWTKGFTCEGVEGEDVVQLLHEAIKRRGVSRADRLILTE